MKAKPRKWLLIIGATLALSVLAVIVVHDVTLPMRSAAAQAKAIRALRTIFQKQQEFRTHHGCFAAELAELPQVIPLDHDYVYILTVGAEDDRHCAEHFVVAASPLPMNSRGRQFFAIDEAGVLRSEDNGIPNRNSPVLQ